MKNKKILSLLSVVMSAVLLLSLLPVSAVTTESNEDAANDTNLSQAETELTLGDVDLNKKVSLADALEIQKFSLSIMEFTDSQILCGDVDKNNKVNLSDCVLVQKYCLDLLPDDLGIGKPVSNYHPTDPSTNPTEPSETETESVTTADPTNETETESMTDPVTNPTQQPSTEPTDPITDPVTYPTEPTQTDTVNLNKTSITLGVGESYTLTKSSPTGSDLTNAVYTSDNEICTLVDGVTGKMTAVSVGTATITITTKNGATANCKVTVKAAPTSISLNKTTLTVGVGETFDFNSSLPSGEGAYYVVYSSSNKAVATVEAAGGLMTAKNTGTAEITAVTYNGIKVSCTVTVKRAPTKLQLNRLSLKLSVGETFDLNSSLPSGEGAYSILYSSDNPEIAKVKAAGGLVTAKGRGIAIITATAYNGVKAYCAVSIGSSAKTLSFNNLCQFPELPTGCEVTALTSVLNYYGFGVSKTTMADNFLPKHTGPYYTGDFRYEFIGNPYTYSGFGCYAPCIVTTAESYFKSIGKSDLWYAENLSGCAPELLYAQILKGNPVVIWATSGWVTPTVNSVWTGRNNESITWLYPEHCLTLIGFNQSNGTVTVSDDGTGTSYSISMSTFESVFKGMGSQAVIIKKK